MTDADFEAFEAHVRANLIPKMDKSEFVISLVPDETDIKFAIELGVSIMLDKPIIIAVRPGIDIPPKLLAVADAVVEGDLTTEDGRQLLAITIAELAEKLALKTPRGLLNITKDESTSDETPDKED